MSRFLNPIYATLEEYVPGEQPQDQKYIKLNTNESPYPPSPKVLDALTRENIERLNLYPDLDGTQLRSMIAAKFGIEPDCIYLANGSDEVLSFAFMALMGEGSKAAFPDISYGFYPVYGDLYRVDYEKIPLRDDFTIDCAQYHGIGKSIVIANPNAPTGIAISPAEIEEILRSNPNNLVIIDEAYVDFGEGISCAGLVSKYDNLMVVQTFSKSRSLAGGRLGFALAHRDIIADLEKIRYSTNPYNLDRLTLHAGAAAFSDEAYFDDCTRRIINCRSYTTEKLREIGFEVCRSSANFVFARHPAISGEELYLRLKNMGILIRHLSGERIKDYNRITIGTKWQMDQLISAVGVILAGGTNNAQQ